MFKAANYLDIKGLLDVTCKTVANMIKGKSPEEIRKTFNIKNDFTEEEEAQVRFWLMSILLWSHYLFSVNQQY